MDRLAIEELLAPINGATFASLDTQTEVTLLGGKKNPHQGRIVKRCLGNRVMLFTNKKSPAYENMVKRRLEAAGLDPVSFNAGNLPWGKRVPDSPFIENKGELYLQCVFLVAGDVKYFLRRNSMFLGVDNFDPIEKKDIIGLNDRTGSEHQGLERNKQVIVRTYAIDSIVALRAFKSEVEANTCQNDAGLWSNDLPR